MAVSRPRFAGPLLLGGIAAALAAFGLLNWHWLQQRQILEREGVASLARIDAVTISHKSCSSSALLSWKDVQGGAHSGRFMTCFANRPVGGQVAIRYLKADPAIAMIAPRAGGIPDSQYRIGAIVGAVGSVLMAIAFANLRMKRRR